MSSSRLRATPAFFYNSQSPALAILADVPQPVIDLRLFGESVLEELREWLDPDADARRAPRYRV